MLAGLFTLEALCCIHQYKNDKVFYVVPIGHIACVLAAICFPLITHMGLSQGIVINEGHFKSLEA